MSDSLIEQVKRLAEESALVEMKLKSVGGHFGVEAAFNNYDHLARQFDFPALLAHMQAQQAVVDAAREYRQVERDIRIGSAGMLNAKLAMHALDAALKEPS